MKTYPNETVTSVYAKQYALMIGAFIAIGLVFPALIWAMGQNSGQTVCVDAGRSLVFVVPLFLFCLGGWLAFQAERLGRVLDMVPQPLVRLPAPRRLPTLKRH